MKKFLAVLMILVLLCGCSPDEKPAEPIEPSGAENPGSEAEEKSENPLGNFGDTDFDSIKFTGEETAYIYEFDIYCGGENEEFSESPVLKYNFATKEASLLPRNIPSEKNFPGRTETDYLYTGNEVLTIKNGEIVSSFAAEQKYGSFCRKNGAYVFSPENNIVKMMKPDFSEAETIFEYPAAEHEFIANTAISPDGEKILLDICYYEAMSQQKVLCISSEGEVLFEINTEDYEGLYDFFWISEYEFVITTYIDDAKKSLFEIFGKDGKLHRTFEFDFYVAGGKISEGNSVTGIIYDSNDVFYLMNYYNGDFEEIYAAPEGSIIRDFDISPDGKVLALIENGEIKTVDLKNLSEPQEIPIHDVENELEKFEATDIQEIQLISDSGAYVYAFNREIDSGEGFKTTVSCMELENAETEILFDGDAYFEYGDMFFVHDMDFSNPWIFTGKMIFSNGIADGGDFEYYPGGYPGECDFDFGNKRYITHVREDKSKLVYIDLDSGNEGLLFDVSGEGEHRFIYSPKVNSDTGNIVFADCDYAAYSPKRLICIDYYGNVIFEEVFNEPSFYDIRWLNDEEFAVFMQNPDEETASVRVYNINSGLKSENGCVFYLDIQNDVTKSYPYAVLCEDVPKEYFRYRLWLYNFEDGSCEELYTSHTKGIIHGFDLSPGGKTLAWIENDDVRYVEIK